MSDPRFCKLPDYHPGPCVYPDRAAVVATGCHCYHAPEQHSDNRGKCNWGGCMEANCECPGVGPAAEGHRMYGEQARSVKL
jgi:hypothetical protein